MSGFQEARSAWLSFPKSLASLDVKSSSLGPLGLSSNQRVGRSETSSADLARLVWGLAFHTPEPHLSEAKGI